MHDKFSIDLRPFCNRCHFFDPTTQMLYGTDEWLHCTISCSRLAMCCDLARRIREHLEKRLFADSSAKTDD